ncbi:MAG: N-acetylneuraminate synthase family protein [Thermodesulfobacteriota bacterium]|nr:N-acetylneuraminate synthase family protein [Thermodesulfobacteriota bacterium]
MKIENIDIDRDVLIIAEIGVNHEGDLERAEQMIDEVADTGAQAVKFQTYYVSKNLYLSTSIDEERYKRTMGYEFSAEQFQRLAECAHNKGLIFLSTPFDLSSVDMLDAICPAFKVSSGDLTFYPLLEKIASKEKPILLSTGMGTENEIEKALTVIEKASPGPLNERVVLLHCVTSYPCPPEAANLNSIPFLKNRFGLRVGYSDHMLGTLGAEVAVLLGARIIEKHYTYRKENQTFRDHQLSADKNDLLHLVKRVREIKKLLGDHKKDINFIEKDNAIAMRRSIGAFVDLNKGDIIKKENLTFLRPATGLDTDKVDAIVGKRLKRSIDRGSIITESDIE